MGRYLEQTATWSGITPLEDMLSTKDTEATSQPPGPDQPDTDRRLARLQLATACRVIKGRPGQDDYQFHRLQSGLQFAADRSSSVEYTRAV